MSPRERPGHATGARADTAATGRTGTPASAAHPAAAGPGADEALAELYAAHWVRLVRLAVLLLHDRAAAEDVVQDAFVATHARWSRLRDHDRAAAYLRQAVVNRARSELRHRAVVRRHAEREAALPEHTEGCVPAAAEAGALAAERRTAVLEALRVLPERQREVVVLRHYLQLSEAEVASALGISRGAVKSHGSRGAARLRTLLASHQEDR